jgi:large subunit ribosomal protein L10
MPNAAILAQKKAIVADLAKAMKEAQAGVLVDYKGINVADDTKLRQNLRAAGVEYKVIKNTLLAFAVKEIGLDGLTGVLQGTTALAYSNTDMVAPAKILSEYAKKSGGKYSVKAGFVEGKPISKEEVASLAELPSKEQLIANVLAGFNAPITGFVNVLNGNLRGLVVALNAIAEKKSA